MKPTLTHCFAVITFSFTAFISYSQTSWLITGNSNINGTTNFIGTTNSKPLILKTNNTDRLHIAAGGSIGIGTTAPENKLHVFKGSAGTVTANINAPLVVENSTDDYVNILAPDANETGIVFGKPQSNVSGGIIYNNTRTANGLQFRVNGNSIKMVLTSGGLLGVNTPAPVVETHIVHGFGSINHGL